MWATTTPVHLPSPAEIEHRAVRKRRPTTALRHRMTTILGCSSECRTTVGTSPASWIARIVETRNVEEELRGEPCAYKPCEWQGVVDGEHVSRLLVPTREYIASKGAHDSREMIPPPQRSVRGDRHSQQQVTAAQHQARAWQGATDVEIRSERSAARTSRPQAVRWAFARRAALWSCAGARSLAILHT